MNVKAISLDIWGTLLRSDPAFKPARNEMLREDLPWHREFLAVGGEWIADRNADPDRIVAEAASDSVRPREVPARSRHAATSP